MPITQNALSKAASHKLADAYQSGDGAAIEQAWTGFYEAMSADLADQFEQAQRSNDSVVLAQRGFRQLTGEETTYYQSVIDALKSSAPVQAFASIPDTSMPQTVIDDVLKNLTETHPLLNAINLTSTGYLTRWILNDHTKQQAAWGSITDAISKEITSAFKVIDIKQGKLTAFACIERGMLDLGPVFLDGYVRTCLGEALANGLEYGVVLGKGVAGEPVGLARDIHEGVTVSTTTGYPLKTAVAVTDFTPASYGALVAPLTKNEKGINKSLDIRNGGSLALICNNSDYLTKIMPATTVAATDGHYVNDLFPVPTQVFISNALEDGQAILALLDEYGMFVGGTRGIEFSDEFKFLDDQRAFKITEYAAGIAYDNTSAALLDITSVSPAYVTVQVKGTVNTKAAA